MSRPWRLDNKDIILSIRLTPRSAVEAIGGSWEDAHGALWLRATVRSVPEKGKANAALIKLLAKALNMAPAAILLESGDTSRLKRVRIVGPDDAIAAKLQTLTGGR
ncbi:DUF167 family protein [Rhizorhapis suberifaciens]|uniref:UPF0235 protein HNQ99_000733 n=1 Tax=Rhizorhapis suberifaciens TaxID=13656 RepID=A0A840HR99_9SPHN|nr:DUF167 family protein [Rhizorhapis suberifaciens]MBB4640445.1 hypothetical protein [Rhizorhapis suberifaciens]